MFSYMVFLDSFVRNCRVPRWRGFSTTYSSWITTSPSTTSTATVSRNTTPKPPRGSSVNKIYIRPKSRISISNVFSLCTDTLYNESDFVYCFRRDHEATRTAGLRQITRGSRNRNQ